MKYIGIDIGDGESAVASYERGSSIEPKILPVCGSKSLLSAVGMIAGEIVIGERAYTDALADGLSVRFKSKFTTDSDCSRDILRFAKGILNNLYASGQIEPEDRFVIGCPAGWNTVCRARYRDLLLQAGIPSPQLISESRAAFLYAKYAKTVALDIDILNESALVADIGSSTLDYAYIVDGRETGVGTFGETELGGGLLDAALLRHAVDLCKEKAAISQVFSESRSWYSYCEIEARRMKEEYYTRLADGEKPILKKQLRICYDGVQHLPLKMDGDVESVLINQPLPELNGTSFLSAIERSLQNAVRVTENRPPKLLLLTGGASRMPFFRKLCRKYFPDSVIVCCQEPEFSIAKGLAYAGWVDENLQAFRNAIQNEITKENVQEIVDRNFPDLVPPVSDALADLITEEALLPILQEWKCGNIATLEKANEQIAKRMKTIMHSPMAEKAIAPAVSKWLSALSEELQTLIHPICDRYEVPRKQMLLNLNAMGDSSISVDVSGWMGASFASTAIGLIVSVTAAFLCGGTGVALIAAGPAGILAGFLIGAIASLLGHDLVVKGISKINLPVLLRMVPLEKKLRDSKIRSELRRIIQNTLEAENSSFRSQISEGFSASLKDYIYSVAQAAEIPIE